MHSMHEPILHYLYTRNSILCGSVFGHLQDERATYGTVIIRPRDRQRRLWRHYMRMQYGVVDIAILACWTGRQRVVKYFALTVGALDGAVPLSEGNFRTFLHTMCDDAIWLGCGLCVLSK